MKHRLIKFIKNTSIEQCTQTEIEDIGLGRKVESESYSNNLQTQEEESPEPEESVEVLDIDEGLQLEPENTKEPKNEPKGYPQRERKAPQYFRAENKAYINVDYCYEVCGAPQTYSEAMNSTKALGWEQAMKDELEALRENDTFELTTLPEGKNLVGGGGMGLYDKGGCNGSETLKARYVAKGYSQVHGIDYEETFSPTANITSVRFLMQLAAQYATSCSI